MNLHALHAYLHRPNIATWSLGGSALAAILIATGIALPGILDMENRRQTLETQLIQTQNTLQQQQQAAAALRQAEAANGNTTPQQRLAMHTMNTAGYTEEDVAYWRKQLEAYSLMSGLVLRIARRAESPYENATTLGITITSPGNLMSPEQLTRALDFLQLYGYVETWNGNEAVVHVKGS